MSDLCNCDSTLIDKMRVEHATEITVTTAEPLVRGPYTQDAFICPHGVRWWMEPTGEQIALWAAGGVA